MQNFFENQWVEIFKTGEQTDAHGNKKLWMPEELETIVNKYNSQKEHEAPIVVGHPVDNSPAFGWVDELKTDGKTLFASFKNVIPEFVEAVKQGLYKKRSISLYPDLKLRHVGFLGGMPPAVKGLADIGFSEEDVRSITYFTEIKEIKMSKITMTKELEDKILQLIDQKLQPVIELLNGKDQKTPQKQPSDAINLKKQLEEAQNKLKTIEYKQFAESLRDAGKLKSDMVSQVVELCQTVYNFGERQFGENKKTALEMLKEVLAANESAVFFGEFAPGVKISKETASMQLDAKAKEIVKERKISYAQALSIAQAENPELTSLAVAEL